MRVLSHPSASIRTAIERTGVVAFAAAALIFAANGPAYAQAVSVDQAVPAADQASPAPAASPAGQTNPGPGAPQAGPNPVGGQPSLPAPSTRPAARPAPAPAPLSHLPILDFVVTFTQPGVYNNMSQLPSYDPLDLGGTVRIPVTRKINLFFDRITEGTLNEPLERSYVNTPGVPYVAGTPCSVARCVATLPKDTRDILLQYHATYTFDRFLTMDVGDSFRHRVFSSGSGTAFALGTNISSQPYPYTISSTEHHFGYLGFTYTTKPWAEFLHSVFALSETLDVQNVDHHVAIPCTAAMITNSLNQCQGRLPNQVGYLDENPGKDKYYETTQGVSWILPVDPKHGTSFLLNERWGYLNFYENAVTPYRWNSALTYQLSKRFSPGFTLAMRHSDFHASSTQSAPFTIPNAIHVGSWDIIGTFHVDTNTFFH